MDNQSSAIEPNNTPLDIHGAANLFTTMLEPPKEDEAAVDTEIEAKEEDPEAVESEPDSDEDAEQPKTITIKVDGKDVEVTLDELKNGYQRQSDYTKKTMEAAEARKAAEAEIVKTRDERNQYAQQLEHQAVLLTSALQEQQKIDWDQLLETDPLEYMKQQRIYQNRQAALYQGQMEQQKLGQLQAAEMQENATRFLSQQQEELLAKLPDWKDAAKAKAEKAALKSYLAETGFSKEEIEGLSDHRSVVVARKAYLYDQMMNKAKAAAKKVENLPQKVQKPGVSQVQSNDKRSGQYQRLVKSGSVLDAASYFSSIL